uniref:Protein MIZU-KUSSEI 1 n=1 Tax=Ananas comosus var. bracteatus TaxID=296719 RepID=A0A6V7P603_ANACO|nr:unnamed protein product [Ananas comosus var. bracteatus]
MPPLTENPGLVSLLRHSAADAGGHCRPSKFGSGGKSGGGGGGIFRVFKLLPMLSSGCKMVALLGRQNKALLGDCATTVTLFGHRRGRVSLAIQEDTLAPPAFLIELPMLTAALHREMASGVVKLALESDTRTHRKKLAEEYVWAVYCNGRKAGYAIRRKQPSDDERHVMQLLRGVSMGAGVLPGPPGEKDGSATAAEGDMTYMRARFERVVGSKDSEALYMINPDGNGNGGPELSIFLVRVK